MKTQWESISELDRVGDLPAADLPTAERVIRGFLLTGFMLVVLIEVWFVVQLFGAL